MAITIIAEVCIGTAITATVDGITIRLDGEARRLHARVNLTWRSDEGAGRACLSETAGSLAIRYLVRPSEEEDASLRSGSVPDLPERHGRVSVTRKLPGG
jgi:hypothetical protein